MRGLTIEVVLQSFKLKLNHIYSSKLYKKESVLNAWTLIYNTVLDTNIFYNAIFDSESLAKSWSHNNLIRIILIFRNNLHKRPSNTKTFSLKKHTQDLIGQNTLNISWTYSLLYRTSRCWNWIWELDVEMVKNLQNRSRRFQNLGMTNIFLKYRDLKLSFIFIPSV